MQIAKRAFLRLALAACLTLAFTTQAMAAKEIVLGGKNYTEQYLLTELAKQILESKGFQVTVKNGVSTSIARQSLENGLTDLYFEYTGTAYTVYHKGTDPEVINNSQKSYDYCKTKDAEKGLIWLKKTSFNNTYTLMMRADEAAAANIKTISDLGDRYKKDSKAYTLAVGTEFWERPDGIKKMMKVYGFRISGSRIKKMDVGITYLALKNKQVDVAMGYSTDGRIAAFNLINLDDDMHFFPVYNPAPVVRKDVLTKYPEIETLLAPLTDKLTADQMQTLNAKVDVDHQSVTDTASAWLKANNLL
ncbi:glycine betaine ABC transporter substrate-binding protein [Desulfoluna spongiiphila]|uniref:glycine betaine ABC transporter substrate-binding protein n=1 Tax=Desulfoluna spongiiphila TaxID=419481 RepID=UPI0012575721|nr:glycine betaine ABC transporter substrate-binding protein [Desulfoluna spongiiphila]VVS91269.1 abc-type glycine betaine transport system substrate-binding domain [Desulfoluna spongiiphila]